MHARVAAVALAAFTLATAGRVGRAAEPEVVAVVACDPYADLKKQVRWVGTLADQPALDAFVETPLMMATQFKGLAGLDVTRPAGLVVTAAADVPAVHAYVPIKNLDKLLDALVGVIGPVDKADGVRRVSPPGGMPLDIVERDGWAIIGPQGAAPSVADPAPLLDAVAKQFTLGVQAFPSRMPAGMRRQLQALLDQAAATAAAQGQPIDREGLAGILENLDQVESIMLGMAIEPEQERVSVESQSRMVPGSAAGAALGDMAQGAATVATPPTSDGKPPALSLHLAAAVPEALRQAAIDGLAAISAQEGSDGGTETAVAIIREALAAMIAAGGYDAALAIDTSAVNGDEKQPLPAVTAGMRVKDGPALEAKIKKLVADAGAVPGLKVAFDTGKAAGANLHTVTVANATSPGADAADPLAITLAVAPTYAFVLAGGDVPARLKAVAGASGRPDPHKKPFIDASVALGPMLRYVAAVGRAAGDAPADPAGLEAAADVADAQNSALVQLLAQPIERGTTLRLSADAGAIRTVAASVKPRAAAPQPGIPLPGGADAIPFPVPVR